MIALAGFARYLAMPLYPLLVQEIALPSLGLATQTGMVNAAAGVAVVLAGIVFGRLADRGAFFRLGTACSLAAGAFTAALAAARSIAMLIPLRMAADFSSGGAGPPAQHPAGAAGGPRSAGPGLRAGRQRALRGLGVRAAWWGACFPPRPGSGPCSCWAGPSFLAAAWLFGRLTAGSAAAPQA